MEENSDKIIGVAGNSSDGHLKDIYGAHGEIGLGFRHEEDHTKFWNRIHKCGTRFAVLTDQKRKSIKPHYCNEPACSNKHCSEYRQNQFFGKYFQNNHNVIFINIVNDNNDDIINGNNDNIIVDRPVWSMINEFNTDSEHDVIIAYSLLDEIRKEIKDKYRWFILTYTSRGIELLRPSIDDEIPSSKEEIMAFVKAHTDISSFNRNVVDFIRANYKNRKRIRSKGIKTSQRVYKSAIEDNDGTEKRRGSIFHAMRYRPLKYIRDDDDDLNLPLARWADARVCNYYVETSNLRADLTFEEFVKRVRNSLGGKISNILNFENYQFQSVEDGEIVTQFIAYFGVKNRKIIKIIKREFEFEFEYEQNRRYRHGKRTK